MKRAPEPKPVRCAIYTRKSTEEGLNQEFNSLDAQRESGEAFISSQKHEGWQCLTERYDDGGFTGGNLDRPAFQRLLADVQAGRIDCVVVYKVDRLSRSLLDFGRVMEKFEQHGVSLVSVTQQFNTTSSMGRLTLNILLSFAQFEREIISERTRDKMAAARKKGKWSGGGPILGYDVVAKKLVVNAAEAELVRTVFSLYLEKQGLLAVVEELHRRGWRTKRWQTRTGDVRGGAAFSKTNLHHLLTNVAYIGQVKYRDHVYPGEQGGIVDPDVFQRVQRLLTEHGNGGRRSPSGALLQGILHCAVCGSRMTSTFTGKGNRRYRYYACTRARNQGRAACPAPSLPAGEIEEAVVDQVRALGRDPALGRATFAQVCAQAEEAIQALGGERRALTGQLRDHHAAVREVLGKPNSADRLAELQERIGQTDRRLAEIDTELGRREAQRVTEAEVREALARFMPVWNALTPREQQRVVQLVVERVTYDGEDLAVTFSPSGFRLLATDTEAAA